jgi:hypothetical protein
VRRKARYSEMQAGFLNEIRELRNTKLRNTKKTG